MTIPLADFELLPLRKESGEETPLEEEYAVFDKAGTMKISFCHSIIDEFAEAKTEDKTPRLKKTDQEMRHKFMSKLTYHKVWLPE